MRIRAKGDARVTLIDERTGAVLVGRFAGRAKKTNDVIEDGEEVKDHTHYRRAIARGDLELLEGEDL